ncbi:MAG: PilZ domain-containing protein [Candidatus Gastranaerophilales bacterium]|nr:PilZ domain-containing protein [Candidatus Gastranaerophilales bacterium]
MKELLKSAKDFKIIPSNFKSSGALNIIDITDEEIKAELNLIVDTEVNDYSVGSNVEIFGVNSLGLIYFETKVVARDDFKITLAMTPDYSMIQRREYSRVNLNQGNIIFKDISQDVTLKIEDISAGGVKLILSQPLELDKYYDIEIKLSSNMSIDCALSPIRIKEVEYDGNVAYLISGKFVDLENADRIVLVQYAFKVKMEEQNKENN